MLARRAIRWELTDHRHEFGVPFWNAVYVQGGPKTGHRLMTIILSNLNRFKNCFLLEDSLPFCALVQHANHSIGYLATYLTR